MHRVLAIAVVALIGGSCAPVAWAVPPQELSACRPETAWAAPDNDIRLSEDSRAAAKSEPLPESVSAQVRAIAEDFVVKIGSDAALGLDCPDLYGAIYRVDIPRGRQLYVVRLALLAGGQYKLIVFDPASRTVSAAAETVYFIEWKDTTSGGSTELPIVSFVDLYGDGQSEIVFEEQEHVGSDVDWLTYHYFAIADDLSLRQVLTRQTRSVVRLPPMTNPISAYNRRLTVLGHYRLRLDTSLSPFDEPSKAKPLGYAILGSDGPGLPFRVLSRHPVKPDYAEVLVRDDDNSEGADDDRFPAHGCEDC